MDIIQRIIDNIKAGFHVQELGTGVILTVLLIVTLMSAYEFCIYRFVSKKVFYAKQFNIALAVIPYFIATIVLSLQTSLVITLGTIGALAIIRFRTAVKDPVDMIYLLWSVHNGIMAGCGLYEVAIITSLVVTVLLLLLDLLPIGRPPYLLVVHTDAATDESAVTELVKKHARNPAVKSRSCSKAGLDLIIQLRCKDQAALTEALSAEPKIVRFTLMSHDSEDVLV